MSRKGNCWNNSPTERFFRSLKYEQLNYEKLRGQEAAKLSILDYLAFYNGQHAHSKPGYQSPLEFEREFYKESA
jgi:putative transposase